MMPTERIDKPILLDNQMDAIRAAIPSFNCVIVRDPGVSKDYPTIPAMTLKNVTLGQFARTLRRVMGATGAQKRVPRPVRRVACVVMRPFRPALARQIRAGVVMDTTEMAFDGGSGTFLDDAVARVMHAQSR